MISSIRQQAEFSGKLAALGGMLRLQAAILWVLRGACVGLATNAGMLLVARFKAFTPTPLVLAALPIALAVAGLLVGLTRPQPVRAVAARTDRQLSLKERLTTALELQRSSATSFLAMAQINDAMWYAQRIDAWRTFPPRLPRRETRALAALVAVIVALAFIPNPAKQAIQRQAAVAQAIKQEAQKLQKTSDDIKQNELDTGNRSLDAQSIDAILSQLQQQLHQPALTAEQALAQLQAAQQKLQANQDSNAETLSEALQALAATFDNQPLLQKVAQEMRSGNYGAAANDLKALGQNASSLSQQERDSLSASLRAAAAAQAKAGNSQLGDALGQAGDALSGDQRNASSAFQQAGNSLQNAGQRSQAQQNLNKAMNQVRQSQSSISQAADQGRSANGSSGSGSDASSADDQFSSTGSPTGSSGDQPGSQPGEGAGQGQNGQGDGSGSGSQGGETIYTGSGSHFEGVPGQPGATGQVASQDDNSLADPANNGSSVPYQQVIGQYQQQASQAMDRGAVPLSYREIVKDYFSSLSSGR